MLQAEWQYVCQCVQGVEEHLQPVEAAIRGKLIPALLEYDDTDVGTLGKRYTRRSPLPSIHTRQNAMSAAALTNIGQHHGITMAHNPLYSIPIPTHVDLSTQMINSITYFR